MAADKFMTTGGDGYPQELFPAAGEIRCTLPTTTQAFIRYVERLKTVPACPSRVHKFVGR